MNHSLLAADRSSSTLQETLLISLPGTTPSDRLQVVLCRDDSGESWLEMRQQSWGEGVGWFNQSKVRVEPSQVAHLRNALGSGSSSSALPSSFRPLRSAGGQSSQGSRPQPLRVIQAETA